MAKKKKKYVLTSIRVKSYKKAMDGKQVKACRESAGLKQKEVAASLGWSVQRWSDFENARHPNPRIGTLLAVCAVLGCKVDEIVAK